MKAGEALIEQAKDVAANLLVASRDDIVLDVDSGEFSVAGTPAVSRSWGEVAAAAVEQESAPFLAEADFQPEGSAFPFGTHLSVVEVDRETGEVTPRPLIPVYCCLPIHTTLPGSSLYPRVACTPS